MSRDDEDDFLQYDNDQDRWTAMVAKAAGRHGHSNRFIEYAEGMNTKTNTAHRTRFAAELSMTARWRTVDRRKRQCFERSGVERDTPGRTFENKPVELEDYGRLQGVRHRRRSARSGLCRYCRAKENQQRARARNR